MDPRAGVTLSALTGRSVRTADGRAVGVVHDLSVRLGVDRPPVVQVLLTWHGDRLLVPWSAVAFDGDGLISLAPQAAFLGSPDRPRREADELHLDTNELLLARDVLDCQIVDLDGRRMTRASDVLLERTPEGGLVLVGVEVGVGAVLRRLGLAWLGGRVRRQVVPMNRLHLSSSRGHQVQLTLATSAIHQLDPTDLAHLLTNLDVAKATDVIQSVGPQRAADALLQAHPVVGRRLMTALPHHDSSRVRSALPATSTLTHPHLHLHEGAGLPRRRLRRLAGWRAHRPPEAPG